MASGHRFNRYFEIGIDIGIVQDRFRMHTNIVVNNELKTRQTDAGIG